jgi:hypothetical protein
VQARAAFQSGAIGGILLALMEGLNIAMQVTRWTDVVSCEIKAQEALALHALASAKIPPRALVGAHMHAFRICVFLNDCVSRF